MINDLEEFLERNFGVVQNTSNDIEDPISRLRSLLSQRIKYFIRYDLDKLLQALYRIDVKDSDSDKAFNLGDIDQISVALSDLIIQRQLKKLEYSKNFNKD
jgi:hypothetical protein